MSCPLPHRGSVQPSAGANPAVALQLQSTRPARRVPELGSLDRQETRKGSHVKDAVLLDGLFRQAVAAIDAGDVVALERLLAEHPRLVRDRLKSPGEWLRGQIGAPLDGFF